MNPQHAAQLLIRIAGNEDPPDHYDLLIAEACADYLADRSLAADNIPIDPEGTLRRIRARLRASIAGGTETTTDRAALERELADLRDQLDQAKACLVEKEREAERLRDAAITVTRLAAAIAAGTAAQPN